MRWQPLAIIFVVAVSLAHGGMAAIYFWNYARRKKAPSFFTGFACLGWPLFASTIVYRMPPTSASILIALAALIGVFGLLHLFTFEAQRPRHR